MSEKTKVQGYEVFEQAMKNYEQALQAGLKLQQESTKWWMDMMTQSGEAQDWQARVNEIASESISLVQKRMEENLKLVEQNSRTSLELLRKATDALKADSISAGQAKMQELWQSSMQAARASAAAINEANAKWAESWMQFIPKAKPVAGTKSATV